MTIHAFEYLDVKQQPTPAVCALFGDEPFLKRLVLQRIRNDIFGEDQKDVPDARLEGDSCQWRDLLDELSTHALFGGDRRCVTLDNADRFITKYRTELEDYVSRPKSTGILVLQVGTWPANTRLYKAIDKNGLQIDCRAPQRAAGRRKVLDEDRLLDWLANWSSRRHNVQLPPRAAELTLDLVGPNLGLLDQELAKLALFVSSHEDITPELVRDVVGGWRTKTTWELIDAAVDGNAAEALRQLDDLLQSGENPLALFGPIAWSLRRFAAATRIIERAERHGHRTSLSAALEQAGFRKWPREALENAQRQIRQLGRRRAGQLYHWLLDADLALKGSHSSPVRARFALEQLIVRLSKQVA